MNVVFGARGETGGTRDPSLARPDQAEATDGVTDRGPTSGVASKLLRGVWRLPSLLVLGFVRVYQLTLSPMLGPACRFHPSCSHYACACLRDHGLVWGGALTVRRIVRCQPFFPGGFDPPPPPRATSLWTRWVLRASAAQAAPRGIAGASVHEGRTALGELSSPIDDVPASSRRADASLHPLSPESHVPLRALPIAHASSQPPVPPHVLAPNDLLRGAP